ncbi:MAG TPA: carboxylesterase/lipase family protein [Acidimicrobiales bacterium]|nr:carboxylesterase/lipase family protein [Acidimicrobiales bacterium]
MNPIVRTNTGRIQGVDKDGVVLFAGVPFAAPPTGPRRFKPPEPHAGWDGVLDATRFGKVSVQTGDSLGSIGLARAPDWSEDCLFLNIQTPAVDDALRPVMVWIHGGAFVNGTGAIPWYDGSGFVIRGNIVVVSINYRLGALGWLYLGHLDPAFASSGNNGLLDQIAALDWVRDNISAFGGHPDNVTIFGESAGAMSVGTLLGTPAASGKFAKAIAQSGAAHNVSKPADAAVVADALLAEIDGGLDTLLGAGPEQILEAQTAVSVATSTGRLKSRSTSASGLPFGPVVDGTVLPRPPHDAVREGSVPSVPLIVGTNRDEWNLFALMAGDVDDADKLRRRVGRVTTRPGSLISEYRKALPTATHGELFGAIMTDRVFRVPAIRLAEAQSQHQPENTFMYLFEYASTAFDGKLGSCHALEIPFVFDTLDKPGVELLTGQDPPKSLATCMHEAWTSFARSGVPETAAAPPWPPYGSDVRATMHFDVQSRIEKDPGSRERLAWTDRI